MDIITIKELKVKAIIGTLAYERQVPQTLKISIDFNNDALKPSQNDDLQDTIDYSALCSFIQEFAQNSDFKLLETFTEKLAQACLEHFPMTWLKLEVQKPFAVPQANTIALTIERSA